MEDTPPFDVEHFIKEVHSRPVLWDSKHPHYNHRKATSSAWEEVAFNVYSDSENWSPYDKFGKIRDVQKRWRNMRDMYVKEVKYERKVEQGLAAPKRKRYLYADLMDFLRPRIKVPIIRSPAKSSSEDEKMDTEIPKGSDILMDEGYSSSHVNQFCKVMYGSQSDSMAEQHFQRNSPEPASKAPTDDQRNISDPNLLLDYTPIRNSHRNFPIYHSHLNSTSSNNVPHKNVPCSEPSTSQKVPSIDLHVDSPSVSLEQDDDKMFLLSLLPYFKKLGEERKLEARINVSKLIHEMLYKKM